MTDTTDPQTADLPARLEAVLTERFTELGNPYSRMRIQEEGPDGWPTTWDVSPSRVAEVLRELLAAEPAAPPAADRAAVLREAANAIEALDRRKIDIEADTIKDAWEEGRDEGADLLRRLADEAQQAEAQDDFTESVIYEVVGDWGVDSADSTAGAQAAVAKWLRAYPKCGAHAQQRIVRDWPDGSEYYGPWTDLPTPPAVVAEPGKENGRG